MPELKIQTTSMEAGFPSKRKDVILSLAKVVELEKKIPLNTLYKAVIDLEKKLRDRNLALGLASPIDDMVETEGKLTHFAHVLEHAILAIIDNNILWSQVSIGKTRMDRNSHILLYLDNKLPSQMGESLDLIRLSLPPSVPGHLQEMYVDKAINGILKELESDPHQIDLSKIQL